MGPLFSGRSRAVLAGLLALLAPLSAAQALVINPLFVDAAGQTWSAARRAVFNRAIADWTTAILADQSVDVTVTFTHAGAGGYLGQWQVGGAFFNGTDIDPWTDGAEHTIRFNADLFSGDFYTWWDPTPTTSADLPFAAWDALSVARHEIAHMMGFSSTFYLDNFNLPSEVNRWTSHISGTTFDPGGLNVTLASVSNLSHVANSGSTAGDLMVPALVNGVRRSISQIDLDMLVLAHDYDLRPVGDFNGDAQVTGADFLIWQSRYPLAAGATVSDGDANGDEAVTGADFLIWQSHYAPGAGTPVAVPEPAGGLMLVTGATALLRRRKT